MSCFRSTPKHDKEVEIKFEKLLFLIIIFLLILVGCFYILSSMANGLRRIFIAETPTLGNVNCYLQCCFFYVVIFQHDHLQRECQLTFVLSCDSTVIR